MKNKQYIWGIALLIIGVLGLLSSLFNLNIFSIENLWPLFILIPGLCFELGYFSTGKAPGILVPGGILTTLGALFFFENLTNWMFSEYTWPVYLLAVAIGLFQLYLFGGREKTLLIPVGILTTIAVVAFATITLGNIFYWVTSSVVWSVLLILAGCILVFRSLIKHNE